MVNKLLSVAESTEALGKRVSFLLESTEWGRQLEWPEEVVGLLELGSAGHDLVDEVLNAVDAVGSELAGDNAVVGEGDSGSVDLTISSLVDKVGDGVTGGVSVSDERLDHSEHVPGGLVQLHEHTVVELSKSEELQDLLGLGGELVDTKHAQG